VIWLNIQDLSQKCYEICPAQLPTMEGLQATEPEFSQMDRISLAWHGVAHGNVHLVHWSIAIIPMADRPDMHDFIASRFKIRSTGHVKDWFKKRIKRDGNNHKKHSVLFCVAFCSFFCLRLLRSFRLIFFLCFLCARACFIVFCNFFPCSKECED